MGNFKVGDVLTCIDHTHTSLILGHTYRVSKIKEAHSKFFVATETTGDVFFFEYRFEKVANHFKGNIK